VSLLNDIRRRDALVSAAAPPAARSLLDILADTVEQHRGRVAIDAPDGILTYAELLAASGSLADRLRKQGIGPGDRVGIRLPSGTAQLYVAILGVLFAGAAYVPVDADDPPARAAAIWRTAAVCEVLGDHLDLPHPVPAVGGDVACSIDDDAWVIFTSGSTGTPKGVAVSHRAAAAFVDAETRLWTIVPEDRVLAGLSVAFDASCEEMWLAWRHGAALVPAPRKLVRAGAEFGPWIAERGITVISTVPTLAAMWDETLLADVRLLIFGGEACPTELAWRLAAGREVWNTYGPTEATVTTTAARLYPEEPVTIGWPLAGWEVAVVDDAGEPVAAGEVGELVIGGVGLGRYLDPVFDAERYAGLPALGWARAYHSGDFVREALDGFHFAGRRDDQVKLGGRRVELSEVEACLSAVAGVRAASATVQTTAADNRILVGYVVGEVTADEVRAQVVEELPDGHVPLVVVLDAMPMTAAGKVDRRALPWPPPGASQVSASVLGPTAAWLAERFAEQLGPAVTSADSDFFAMGGTSLLAAKLVSVLRARFPSVAVADIYNYRRLGQLAARLDQLGETHGPVAPAIARRPLRFGALQLVGVFVLLAITSSQWIIAALAYGDLVHGSLPHVGWGWLIAGWLALASPLGRMGLMLLAKSTLLRDLRPGRYSRYSWFACRIWFVQRLAEVFRLGRVAGTPWASRYARLVGADVGPGVNLRSVPAPTSLVQIGAGATLERDVDMHGWWIDGQELVIDEVRIGTGASVGAHSVLMGGAVVDDRAEIEPGSVVSGVVPAGERWSGRPARLVGQAGEGWPRAPAPRDPRLRFWRLMFGVSFAFEGLLVLLAFAPAYLVLHLLDAPTPTFHSTITVLLAEAATITVLSTVTFAVLVALALRLVWRLVRPGSYHDDGLLSWALWFSEDLKQGADAVLFPIFESLYARPWLRLMGVAVGRRTELSTMHGLNRLVSFGELVHTTDDVAFCGARARAGRLHISSIEIGNRTFLGNTSVLLDGTQVGDESLVGVLTVAPRRAGNGTSWFGAPALELPRVREVADPARTTNPPRWLILARAAMELVRIVLPNTVSVLIAILVLLSLDSIGTHYGIAAMIVSGPLALLAGALLATAFTVLGKWIVVGRYRSSEHPLWSFFVWRDELVNSMGERLAGEWLLRFALGTPLMSLYLRAMGSRVGRGVWVETLAVTEYDVTELGESSAINRGGILMTHLFHDRLLRIGPTSIGAGATLGPSAAVLPDTKIGAGACIGAHSVVLRGEELPPGTRWHGAPVVST
jgi:non-ribosomal peptide synthetase-like protein